MDGEKNIHTEVDMFRRVRDRMENFCEVFRDLLRLKMSDKTRLPRILGYLKLEIRFERTSFDEPFSVTGLDCLLMMLHNDVYRRALTVKQLPEVCDLIASQPERFKQPAQIWPKEINRSGELSFYVYPEFCRDRFAYTFPGTIFTNFPRIIWN